MEPQLTSGQKRLFDYLKNVIERTGSAPSLRQAAQDEAGRLDQERALAAQAKVDGVIVHAPKLIDERIDLLGELGLPFLVHGRDGRPVENYSWIDMNNRRAFQRATEFLIDLGHRRIGLINGMETMCFAQRRRMGYEQALCSRDIALDPDADYHFHRGAAYAATYLGYDARELATLPDSCTSAFAGVAEKSMVSIFFHGTSIRPGLVSMTVTVALTSLA